MKRKKKRKRKNSKNWNEKERLDENGSSWIELFFKWDEPVVAILQLAPLRSRVLGRQEIRHYSYSLLSRISLREFNVESSHRAALRWFQDFTRAQRRTGEREGDEEKEKKKLNKIKEIFFLCWFFFSNWIFLLSQKTPHGPFCRESCFEDKEILGKMLAKLIFQLFFSFFSAFSSFFSFFSFSPAFFPNVAKLFFPIFCKTSFNLSFLFSSQRIFHCHHGVLFTNDLAQGLSSQRRFLFSNYYYFLFIYFFKISTKKIFEDLVNVQIKILIEIWNLKSHDCKPNNSWILNHFY